MTEKFEELQKTVQRLNGKIKSVSLERILSPKNPLLVKRFKEDGTSFHRVKVLIDVPEQTLPEYWYCCFPPEEIDNAIMLHNTIMLQPEQPTNE